MVAEEHPEFVTSDGKAMFVRGRYYHLSPGRAIDMPPAGTDPMTEYIERHADEIVANIWASPPGQGA